MEGEGNEGWLYYPMFCLCLLAESTLEKYNPLEDY